MKCTEYLEVRENEKRPFHSKTEISASENGEKCLPDHMQLKKVLGLRKQQSLVVNLKEEENGCLRT